MQILTVAENLQTTMTDFPGQLIVRRERDRQRECVRNPDKVVVSRRHLHSMPPANKKKQK